MEFTNSYPEQGKLTRQKIGKSSFDAKYLFIFCRAVAILHHIHEIYMTSKHE